MLEWILNLISNAPFLRPAVGFVLGILLAIYSLTTSELPFPYVAFGIAVALLLWTYFEATVCVIGGFSAGIFSFYLGLGVNAFQTSVHNAPPVAKCVFEHSPLDCAPKPGEPDEDAD